jgi:hypothetical protein
MVRRLHHRRNIYGGIALCHSKLQSISFVLRLPLIWNQHDDLEHLCLIERMIGYFPYRLIRDSPLGDKYFHRDGLCRTEALSNENYRFVNKSRRLEDIFTLEPDDVTSGIVPFMKGLLTIDPKKRCVFFSTCISWFYQFA